MSPSSLLAAGGTGTLLVLLPVCTSVREENPLPPDPAEEKPGFSWAKPQTTVCSWRVKIADCLKSRDAKYLPSEHKACVVLPVWQTPPESAF